MIDYHLHTFYSEDGKMSMRQACIRATELGLKEIAFTDHMDPDWPDKNFSFEINDIESYIEEIEKIREEFKGRLVIKKGIEIGLQPHTLDRCSKIICSYPFDFVIASVHIVDRKDPYYPAFYKGKTKQESYCSYYREVLELVKAFDHFNVLGHLDYIRRYSPFQHEEEDYLIGIDIVKDILKTLISKGKGIEVNTSACRHHPPCIMPHPYVLDLYRQLGGEIITLGSDAHKIEEIACGFPEALKEIRRTGFTHLTSFSGQKPQPLKIL